MRGPVLVFVAVLGCSRATTVGPAPEAPRPALASGVYRLVVSSMNEISCSQSFQTDTQHVGYDLALRADGSAQLDVVVRKTSAFGPSASKFSGGPATRTKTEKTYRYVGRGDQGATFDGREEKLGGALRLRCMPKSVALDKGQVDAIACDGLPFLPDDARDHFKGPAPLALAPGLLLVIDDHGHGSPFVALRRGY